MCGRGARSRARVALVICILSVVALAGCKAMSDRLSRWPMLGGEAPEDPIRAVGGDGIVFAPHDADRTENRDQLRSAGPQELVAYYAPVFVQQRVDTAAKRHPYPPEYDEIGEARMRRDDKGKLKALVAGPPKIYAIYEKRPINGHDYVQLTYTAWYPAHPRMKMIDLEEADIDSCVVRVTLDDDHCPILYETIAACGCFHKVFVEHWLEDEAARSFGVPEKGKKYCVEQTLDDSIDWEVAGIIDEPHDRPRRPVVFIKAGDHKVLGVGSAARLRVPTAADTRPYELGDYAELYSLPVADSTDRAPFFDLKQGGKVYGAERKERFIFSLMGVDGAGQPRAVDEIKMHFDQSSWSDPTIYGKYLRLPPGTL